MKTVAVIGKNNEALQAERGELREHFKLLFCAEGTDRALGMLRAMKPDAALIDLAGFLFADRALFGDIQREFPWLPVLAVGGDDERAPFTSFFWGEQIKPLARGERLLPALCKCMNIDEKELQGGAAAQENSRKKVLVVDDNATTLRSIKTMLEEWYDITLATSGMKAMASIGRSRPDVILLDYEMPVCDGRQTLEMIRADEEIANIPVIFLTSVNDAEHIQAVLTLKPAGYLLKPAVPARLIETIETALGKA